MNIRIELSILAVLALAFVTGCATEPPSLPRYNAADSHVQSSSGPRRTDLRKDETTIAIEKQLSGTQADAESAQNMQHDMQSMPGMQHGAETQSHEEMKHGENVQNEKKALADEMKKTSDEMKATSDAMKQKSAAPKTEAVVYTCPMHPQIRSDKPGKCPICGMTLVKKEQIHEGH